MGALRPVGRLTGEQLIEHRPVRHVVPLELGGVVVPVNKLGLVALRLGSGQAPWMGLAGLAALGVVLVRRRKL